MKVLIVDDNEAIQEILSEILSVDGYETRTASSIEGAADEITAFRPDAILLDSTVGDRNGLELIDTMLAKGHQLSNVLVLAASGEQIPKDSTAIAGTIQKPFKSTDVLEKMRELFADTTKEKPKRSIFKALFGKKSEDVHEEVQGIRFGRSYLFIESDPTHSYIAAAFFNDEGCDVMVITSGKLKAARERLDDVKIIALSGKEGPDYVEPEMMGTLMGTITAFITEHEKPVILIDDLDLLIEKNDLNAVLTLIHQVINKDSGKSLTLLVSTRSSDMTEKDRELLQHSMEIRVFEE